MRKVIAMAAVAAFTAACAQLPDPETVLRCKAQVFGAANGIKELIETVDPPSSDQTVIEQLLSVGLTAAEAQTILDQLNACVSEGEAAQ